MLITRVMALEACFPGFIPLGHRTHLDPLFHLMQQQLPLLWRFPALMLQPSTPAPLDQLSSPSSGQLTHVSSPTSYLVVQVDILTALVRINHQITHLLDTQIHF